MSIEPADLFDSFNARSLRPREVAKTFVPPKAFASLIKRRHSIVVGPRGTGKTTLLKMLQQAALEYWENPIAERVRQSVDYTGVFVATDVRWKSQLDSLAGVGFNDDQRQLLTSAAFTTNVLSALCAAMIRRCATSDAPHPHRRVSLRPDQERDVVKALSDAWHLQPALPTLRALRNALSQRLLRLRELSSMERLSGPQGRDQRFLVHDWLHIDYLDASIAGVSAFDSVAEQHDGLWAFLFDELELAPTWIREQLFESLRSVDGRLLFKLSISPYDEQIRATSMLAPMPDNDYDVIPLTYTRREDAYEFCGAIWATIAGQHGDGELAAASRLGPSVFEGGSGNEVESSSAYGRGSAHRKRFKELERDDATFAEYVRKRGLDLDKLDAGAEQSRAAEIRKIISLVAVRHTFRMPDNSKSKQRVRSRKNPTLYVGARSVFAIVEANPRWLIAIGSRMLTSASEDGRIPPAVQNREISAAADRFMAMLHTIPSDSPTISDPESSVGKMVEAIGEFFFNATVLAPFNPEPPGSFTVDDDCSPEVIATLGKALNAGAIVYVPAAHDEPLIGHLPGKRFRLSYLLAPHFRIPVRLGRAVSLRRVLSAGMHEPADADASLQPTLFDSFN